MRRDSVTVLVRGGLALAALQALAGCGRSSAHAPGLDPRAPASHAPAVPAPCALPLGVDTVMARCLTIRVPENRQRPEGHSVPLRVIVVSASGVEQLPDPVFYFSGGPGQAATDGLAGTLSEVAGTRSRRALVLIDQRGTGASRPLRCEAGDVRSAVVGWLTGAFDMDMLRTCRARLVSEGVDLAHYATADAVEDVEDVRRALGYERINLFGISYGTRVAAEYLRKYPVRTRTATLRGLHAPDSRFPLDVARDAQRALDLTLRACDQDQACRATYPAVRDDLTVAFAQARTRPARLALGATAGGRVDSVTVTPDVLAGSLLFALYSTQSAAAIPGAARAAARGDVTRWASPGFLVAFGASRTIALGMYLSVVCAEDVPRIPSRGVDSRARGTFLGDALVRNLRAACDVWLPGVRAPHAPPLRSPVPTLVLTGDVDPVTPPRWGEQLLPGLPRGRQVVLAATGHVPSMSPCAATLFARFVDAGAAEGLDVSCARVSTRPPFLLEGPGPRAGPGGRTNAPATQRITDVSGRWDLHWQTTKGPSQSGYLVIRQSGAALQAEVHGDGTLEATGTSRGDSLVLSGRRIVNFEIRAIARADTLTGVLKVLTVERRFTGVRRR